MPGKRAVVSCSEVGGKWELGKEGVRKELEKKRNREEKRRTRKRGRDFFFLYLFCDCVLLRKLILYMQPAMYTG